jgi:colanic acid/amylovoran biosynthesis protein
MKASKVIAKYIFNQVNLIYSRETYSTKIVRDLSNDPKKVIEASDMGFLMEPEPVKLSFIEKHPFFIGVNLSGLLYFENKPNVLKWNRADYHIFMRDVIIHFVQDYNQQVLLIPHVIKKGTYENDIEANRQLWLTLPEEIRKRTEVITESYSAPQLKYIISQSEFFIGARMHACIAALSSCVPVCPISYSHKFEGILRQLNLENLICDPLKSSNIEMLNLIMNSYENRGIIKAKLREVIPIAQQRAQQCVDLLC